MRLFRRGFDAELAHQTAVFTPPQGELFDFRHQRAVFREERPRAHPLQQRGAVFLRLVLRAFRREFRFNFLFCARFHAVCEVPCEIDALRKDFPCAPEGVRRVFGIQKRGEFRKRDRLPFDEFGNFRAVNLAHFARREGCDRAGMQVFKVLGPDRFRRSSFNPDFDFIPVESRDLCAFPVVDDQRACIVFQHCDVPFRFKNDFVFRRGAFWRKPRVPEPGTYMRNGSNATEMRGKSALLRGKRTFFRENIRKSACKIRPPASFSVTGN